MGTQYIITCKPYKSAGWGRTRWAFDFFVDAQLFAEGYRAALHDLGKYYIVAVHKYIDGKRAELLYTAEGIGQ